MRLFANANYQFIESRKKAYVLSAIAILAGIAAMIVNVFAIGSWQNYGVDFTGGSLVQVRVRPGRHRGPGARRRWAARSRRPSPSSARTTSS